MRHYYILVFTVFITSFGFGQTVFINEIHYDDASGDSGEGVEIAGPAGTDLSTYTITAYNGSNGSSYDTESLSGIITDQSGTGYGTIFFPIAGLQNGAPDGIALENSGTLIQFLSYEGSFTAIGGVADGQISMDIGVSENGSVEGESLQLIGTGTTYADFTWNASSPSSYNLINSEQSFGGSTATSVQFASSSVSVDEGDGTYNLDVEITNEDGSDATTVEVKLTSGSSADLTGFVDPTEITFPAGTSGNQTVILNINDDSVFEGDETLTFTLQNASGGNNATVGTNSTFDLTITDNDPDPSITIALQDFDGTLPSWNYTTNPSENSASCVSGGDVWNVVNSLGSITVPNSTGNFFGGQDLNGATGCGTTGVGTIDFADIITSGFSNIVITFNYEVDGFNSGTDELSYIVTYFDPSFQQLPEVFLCDGCNQQNVEGTASISIPDGTSLVRLQIRAQFDGGSDYFGIDNVRISGIYSGLAFTDGSWTPSAPSGSTGFDDALILDGVATINSSVALDNVVVNPGAGLIIDSSGSLDAQTLDLESNSSQFSSLIVDGTLGPNIVNNVTYRRWVNEYEFGGSGGNDLITSPVVGIFFGDFVEDFENSFGFFPIDPLNHVLLNDFDEFADPPQDFVDFAFAPWDPFGPLYQNFTYNLDNPGDGDDYFEEIFPFKGYRIAPQFGTTLAFRGGVNSGTVNTTDFNALGFDPLDKWNLVGNPYPSYLNAQAFLSYNGIAGLDVIDDSFGAIYGYNDSTDSSASGIWTIINGFQNTSINIAPGQAFFVPSNGSGELEFTPTMRTTTGTDDFIQGRNTSTDPLHIRLVLSNSQTSFGTDFYFSYLTSTGLNPGYDAGLYGGNAPDFALYSELVTENQGIPMAIQALGETDYNDITIALGVNAAQGEELVFSIDTSDLPPNINIYLEDNVANTWTLLNTGDYIITPNNDLNGTGRFYLHFSDNALSTPESSMEQLIIYANNEQQTIVISGELLSNTTATLYDLQGREVSSQALDITQRSQEISVDHLSAGIYIVQVQNQQQSQTKKVILR